GQKENRSSRRFSCRDIRPVYGTARIRSSGSTDRLWRLASFVSRLCTRLPCRQRDTLRRPALHFHECFWFRQVTAYHGRESRLRSQGKNLNRGAHIVLRLNRQAGRYALPSEIRRRLLRARLSSESAH